MTKNTTGRLYAKKADVKVGSILEPDGGFDCMECGAHLTVEAGEGNSLHVPCATGFHNLDGQLIGTDGSYYIGLYQIS